MTSWSYGLQYTITLLGINEQSKFLDFIFLPNSIGVNLLLSFFERGVEIYYSIGSSFVSNSINFEFLIISKEFYVPFWLGNNYGISNELS